MKKILIIILTIFLITGNNDYQELNDLSIISSIYIDYQNNNYLVYFQSQNPNQNNNEFIIYKTNANTIEQAFNNILEKTPNVPYYKHLEVLFISESIAIDHLPKIINYFQNTNNTRNEFNILINKNNNPNIINIPSTTIKNIIKTNTNYIGISQNLTFNDLLDNYLNPYKEITIPSIEIENNNEIKLSTIAIFDNNKLIKYLTEEENIIFNIINNNIKRTTIKNNYNNSKYYVIKINYIKSKLKLNTKNNTLNINIKGKYNIKENTTNNIINYNTINN